MKVGAESRDLTKRRKKRKELKHEVEKDSDEDVQEQRVQGVLFFSVEV